MAKAAKRWDAERHERLLKTVVKHFDLKKDALIAAYNADWAGTDELTKRAIEQHFTSLNAGKPKTPTKKTPVGMKTPTPNKPKPQTASNPKTPASGSNKRKKASMSDDEDEDIPGDDEEEDILDDDMDDDSDPDDSTNAIIRLARRATIPRSSKTAARSKYLESDDMESESEHGEPAIDEDLFTRGTSEGQTKPRPMKSTSSGVKGKKSFKRFKVDSDDDTEDVYTPE